MMLNRILVPTDFSASADHALRLAVGLARRDGGSITLMHVAPFPIAFGGDFYGPMPILDLQPTLDQIGKESNHLLERLAKQEVPEDVKCALKVVLGAAADEIAMELEKGGYDLVVLGTHGRTGIPHMLLGSVAERVLRHSAVPVLVTR